MKQSKIPFVVKPRNQTDQYFGFELDGDPLHIMPDGTIFHNSGKSVMEQSIIGHVSRYSDKFQLIGVDCKRVEFNLIQGVKGVKGIALDVQSAAAVVAEFQHQMMERYEFMQHQQVNNIYQIKDIEVDYYEYNNVKYQFDELFTLTVDLDPKDRNYEKLKMSYTTGRQPLILSMKNIYEGMLEGKWDGRHPQMPVMKGVNSYIDRNSIRKSKGKFVVKAMLLLCDEMNELMNAEDYKSVDTIKQGLGSIARLGRAAAVHIALACQRAAASTISTDLKNNIQLSVLLGAFDTGASEIMFEKDISNQAKPQIKGRGFIGFGNEIVETQTYFTQPEKDWVFDTDAYLTYENSVFQVQQYGHKLTEEEKQKIFAEPCWVKQVPLDQVDEEDDTVDESDLDDEITKLKKRHQNDDLDSIDDDEDEDEEDNFDDDTNFDEEEWDEEEDNNEEDPTILTNTNSGVDEFLDNIRRSEELAKSIEATISTRDRVESAIDAVPQKKKIKLNFDKITSEEVNKPTNKIKLNFNKKDK